MAKPKTLEVISKPRAVACRPEPDGTFVFIETAGGMVRVRVGRSGDIQSVAHVRSIEQCREARYDVHHQTRRVVSRLAYIAVTADVTPEYPFDRA